MGLLETLALKRDRINIEIFGPSAEPATGRIDLARTDAGVRSLARMPWPPDRPRTVRAEGKPIWTRLRYIKDPLTGKRVSRLSRESEWTVKDVPDLRIVGDELW